MLKVCELLMSALETLLKGVEIVLVGVLKYIREAREALSETIDELRQGPVYYQPKRLHVADHEF